MHLQAVPQDLRCVLCAVKGLCSALSQQRLLLCAALAVSATNNSGTFSWLLDDSWAFGLGHVRTRALLRVAFTLNSTVFYISILSESLRLEPRMHPDRET